MAAVRRFTDHFKIAFQFQHLAKAFAHDCVIIRQQNSNFFMAFQV